MSNLIRATGFLRVSDYTLYKLDCYEKGKNKQYEDDLEIVIRQIQQTNPRTDERNKLQTSNGSWYFKLDDNRICYLVLTAPNYPERQSFAMIKEMEKEMKKMTEYSTINPKEAAKHIKFFIKDLHDKYNNLTGIDKIAQAQQQIDEVQLVMEDNVKRMLDNNTQLDGLDQKADEMQLKSKQFQQQSTDLARIMYWRNVKLKAAIFIIILAILLYISIPFIISASSNDSGSSDGSNDKEVVAANTTQNAQTVTPVPPQAPVVPPVSPTDPNTSPRTINQDTSQPVPSGDSTNPTNTNNQTDPQVIPPGRVLI